MYAGVRYSPLPSSQGAVPFYAADQSGGQRITSSSGLIPPRQLSSVTPPRPLTASTPGTLSPRPLSVSGERRFPFYKTPPAAPNTETVVVSESVNAQAATQASSTRGISESRTSEARRSARAESGPEDSEGETDDQESKNWRFYVMWFSLLAGIAFLGVFAGLYLIIWRRGTGAMSSITAAPAAAPVPAATPIPTLPAVDDGYDYIIVGAGTAGMIVAKELSENQSAKILLIEGGGTTNVGRKPHEEVAPDASWAAAAAKAGVEQPSIYDVPGEYERIAWGDNYSWYSTFTFQGKGLGGSAAVNKMVYVRPTDAQLASMGWPPSMIDPLKKAFSKIEQDMPAVVAPSMDGKLYARGSADIVDQLFVNGSGFTKLDNINDPSVISSGTRTFRIGVPPQIASQGRRANSATVYEPKLRQRPNVEVVTHSEVKRIKFSPQGHALWLDYLKSDPTQPDGQKLYQPKLRSNGKVVLTAGALNTPRLLLLSGVGPLADIQGYSVLVNAPANEWRANQYVGTGLKDHVQALMGFTKPGTELFNPKGEESTLLDQKISWLVNKTGPYAQYGPTTMLYFQSPQEAASGSNQPDIQVHALPHAVSGIASVRYLNDCNMASGNQMCVFLPTSSGQEVADRFQGWPAGSWAMYVTLLKTASKATMMLDEQGRVKYPTEDLGPQVTSSLYLAEPEDVARLKYGVEKVFNVMSAYGFTTPQLPLNAASIDAAVNSWETSHLIANAWSSSCMLGSCLDEEFRVVNTSNVFVADASAMPQAPVQPVGTVMAAAVLAAARIRGADVQPEKLKPPPALVPLPPGASAMTAKATTAVQSATTAPTVLPR